MSALEIHMNNLAKAMDYDISSGAWDAATLMACAAVQLNRLKARIAELEVENNLLKDLLSELDITTKPPEEK